MATQYIIGVQPSIVIHWNTVNIANPILSKLVIPLLGPSQPSTHSVFPSQLFAPDLFSKQHGTSLPPSSAISAKSVTHYFKSQEQIIVIKGLARFQIMASIMHDTRIEFQSNNSKNHNGEQNQ